MVQILYIDSDKNSHETLRLMLQDEFTLISSYNKQSALESLEEKKPEIVLINTLPANGETEDILREINRAFFAPPVIVIEDRIHVPNIVRLVRMGAFDFIPKPYTFKQLKNSILRAMQFSSWQKESCTVDTDYPELALLVGESSCIQEVKMLICRFAQSDLPVLITGESGTGKEIVASCIHNISSRRNGPYLVKNCGAIPATLLQSEIFGSEKGAFTDAVTRPGSFELAHKGTLFLDEIAEMETDAQVNLLRILESKTVTRIGGLRSKPIDVRIISATNKSLPHEISEKRFREDLYYRINTLPIKISPLRERKEDIPLLTKHFLREENDSVLQISFNAIQKLNDYSWPGNVRELKSVIHRAILLSEKSRIEAGHIQF